MWHRWHDGRVESFFAGTRGDRALVVHGAGSTAGVARRLVPPILFDGAAMTYLTDPDCRPRQLSGAIQRWQNLSGLPGRRFVAGISFGAHALAIALSGSSPALSGALLVMPAWSGPPGHTASLTESAARTLQASTTSRELQRLIDLATPDQEWIVSALRSSWASQPRERLVAGMTQAAATPGPTIAELGAIVTPTVIVGLRDDLLHPVATARLWQDVIPNARYVEVTSTLIQKSGSFATPEVRHAWHTMVASSR